MQPKHFAIFVAVPAVALTLGFATFDLVRTSTPVLAAEAAVAAVAFGGSHQGWSGGRHGRGLAHLCGPRRDAHIEDAIGTIEDFVTFTLPQDAAWSELTAAVRESSTTVAEACRELTDAEVPGAAPARLARFATMVGAGLEVLNRVRPPFDAFYQTLDEKQRKRIDKLFDHGHRR